MYSHDQRPSCTEQHRRLRGRRRRCFLLVALTVVFTLIRVLLYLFVVRSAGRRRSGLAVGILQSINSFGSRSRRGLDASAMSALPVTAYRKESASTGGAGADCAVCLSEFADGEKVRELPNCGHMFHVECVDAWLRTRTTCPLCRTEAELPQTQGNGKAEAASSSATEPPVLFGAGGTLIVTVHGVSDTRRDVPVSGPGQLGSS
ncbi:hypothetical protein ACQ4PT_037487 [Festuca glaucescens]